MGDFTAFPLSVYPSAAFPDAPVTSGFSLATAGTMTWAAQAAYEVSGGTKLTDILRRWNWQLVAVFDKLAPGAWVRSGATGYVARTGNITVVAVAGTEPEKPTDWLEDFKMVPDSDGAHPGFLDGARTIGPVIDAAMSEASGPIILTGHSLGAAIVAMAAMRMTDEAVQRLSGVYTIGMPRPGTARYRDAYNPRLGARTFRLVHGEDLVTTVPPASIGYRAVGALLACPRGGRFQGAPTIPPDEGPLPVETAELPINLLPLGNTAPRYPSGNPLVAETVAHLSGALRDHLPDGYLRALGVMT